MATAGRRVLHNTMAERYYVTTVTAAADITPRTADALLTGAGHSPDGHGHGPRPNWPWCDRLPDTWCSMGGFYPHFQ